MGSYVSLLNMEIKATNVFKRNFQSTARYVINRWGTRSSKTYSLAQLCALRLYAGKIEEEGKVYTAWILSIVRKHSTTIRTTAMRDFEDVLDSRDIRKLVDINKTEKTYRYWGRTVEFFWADDEQKVRWATRDILYCNEANELKYDQEFFQLMIRTKDKIFIDFNPDNEEVWINQELEIKRKAEVWDVDIIVSTYKDNPFLPEMQVKEIERLSTTNPQYWKIYGLWEYGRLEWVIFHNRKICDFIPDTAKFVCMWLDFWYTNDPTALIEIRQWDNTIFLNELIYETWLTNLDIDAKATAMWVDKSEETIADSAEPKSIEELFRNKRNIKPAKKWKDSITYWISLMQQYSIAITPNSKNLIREFKSYCWWKDKNWKMTNIPEWWFDHGIDAVRYAFMAKLDRKQNSKELQPYTLSWY